VTRTIGTVRSIGEELARLPSLLRIGLLVFVIGSGLDLLYHAGPPAWVRYLVGYLGPDGDRGHLVIMAGMGLIVLGLLVDGIVQARWRNETEGK
jgi:hypothetical protein